MTADARDPRLTPKAGDVLKLIGDAWTVIEVADGRVEFDWNVPHIGPYARLKPPLAEWRSWAATAEVVKRGE